MGEGSVFSHIQFIHHDEDRACLHLIENAADVKTEDSHHEEQQSAGEPDGEDGCGIAANLIKLKEICYYIRRRDTKWRNS